MLLFAFSKDCSSSCIRQEWQQKANSWNSLSSQYHVQQSFINLPSDFNLRSHGNSMFLWSSDSGFCPSFISFVLENCNLYYNLGFDPRLWTTGLLVSKGCHLRKLGFLHSSRVVLWERQYDSSSIWHCQLFSCHGRHHLPSGRFI